MPGSRRRLAALAALFCALAPAARAYDNSACWHYAAQQGPRPDITCTKIDLALLQSLQNASLAQVTAIMNEPGIIDPDGKLNYIGDDQSADGGLQGSLSLTVDQAGQVTGIAARLDNPTQGGAYLFYRWTASGAFCSDLPGAGPPCRGP